MSEEDRSSQNLSEGKSPTPRTLNPSQRARAAGRAGEDRHCRGLAIVVVAVLMLKNGGNAGAAAQGPAESATPAPSVTKASGLPRMIELGSVSCIPCKMMATVLDELRKDYSGALQVDFIDVNKDREAATQFGIRVIPTQVFLDASGKELFRHEGFFPEGGHPGEVEGTGREPALFWRDGSEVAMQELFAALTRAVESTPAIALGAAFVWGVLSILLSPCHLASIPLIVGFIDEQGRISTRRAFTISALFAVGILITIAAIGAVTAAAGRMMGDVGRYGNYFVAAIFFVVGLHLLDVIPMPWSGPGQVGMKRKGMLAAFILGLVFGVALGPCTFAYMAPMLGVTFKLASTSLAYGVLLLAVYGVGHCSVIVFAGTFTEVVQRYLNWNEKSKGAVILKKVCGVLVLLGGIYLIYTA